jgi:hypothetical protein
MSKPKPRPKGQGANFWIMPRKGKRYIYLRWNGSKRQVYLAPLRSDFTTLLDGCFEGLARWRKEHLKHAEYLERVEKLKAAAKYHRGYPEEPMIAYPELISLLREKARVQPRPEPVLRFDDKSRAVHHRELFHAAVHRMVEIRAARAAEKKFAKYRTTAPPQHTAQRAEVAAAR